MAYSQKLLAKIANKFEELYKNRPQLLFSPGRINLIGEHTDYNEGFVMPGAINLGIYIAFAQNHQNIIRMYSSDLQEEAVVSVDEIQPISTPWANYILGVVKELQKIKGNIYGFDLVFGGDIPIGAGLSSSAALESGVGLALDRLFKLNLQKVQIIRAGQQAEHLFVGVRCGIMDQFASVMGWKDHLIQLDCRFLNYKYAPWAIEGYQILLFNSKVKHSLAESQYNRRRLECEKGVKAMQKDHPEVKSLRDASLDMLNQLKGHLPENIHKRCSYVIEENNRVLEASSALAEGNLQYLGTLLFESHKGLSENYEVSCKELDFMVSLAHKNEAVAGARMMGGGFGGCTINLVKESKVNDVIKQFEEAYFQEFEIKLEWYKVKLQNGTHLINQEHYGTIQS